MQKILLSALFVALILRGQLFGQTTVQDRIQQVENGLMPFVPVQGFPTWNLLDRMKYYNVKGVSIAVIHNFKVEWAKGYGWADTLKKTPVTTETLFSAGSISKFVMAAGAFKLVENQKLTLDAPINNYLKSWQLPDNDFTKITPVTLRMLLSHTAGTSQSAYFGFTPDKNPLPTIVDILRGNKIAESRGVAVVRQPNTGFQYSGGGSMVAQMAIMDASGLPFEDFMQKNVFQPLKMTNATFAQPLPVSYQNKAAWGYSNAPWYKGTPYVYPQQAAAGLYTNATDLAKFIVEIQKSYHGKSPFLSQNSVKTMFTPQAEISKGAYLEQTGVGPFLLQRADNAVEKGQYFEFQGANAGFIALAIGNFTEGYGAVILLNSGDDYNGLGKEIRRSIAQVYGWHNFLPEPVKPLTINNLDSYVGRYRRGVDEVVYIRKEKNYLVERINDGFDIYCFPIGKDSVIFTDFNVKGFFETDASGRATSLRSEYQSTPMPRMRDDEFTPTELFKMKQYEAAKAMLRPLNWNVSQLTYAVYEMMNKPNVDDRVTQSILELAEEQYPKESVVYARWTDFYTKLGNKEKALENAEKAVKYDPLNEDLKEKLRKMKE